MKKTLALAAAALLSLAAAAQTAPQEPSQAKEQPKFSVKPYGFVRNYLNVDSRKMYTVIGGEYDMMPYDESWNADHTEDLNAVAHAQLQALTSRVGLDIKGPMLLGMNSSGKVEGDFGGFGTTNTVFRLRQAFVKLSAAKGNGSRELLVGQTWHPLSGDIMPEVLGMAAGAPFRPHSRTPQVRTINYFGAFGFTAALLYQLQFMNNGPTSATNPASTASTDFANQALWPEAFLGLNLKQDGFYVQLGLDAQVIKPRTHAPDAAGVVRKVSESVTSLTPTLYAQYSGGLFAVKARTLLAQNTSHLNQLVGYGVTAVNADGSWEYAPLRATISYLNLAYGKKCRANLFFGYMKNLGSSEELLDFGGGSYRIYMKGGDNFTHLNSIWRVAPSVSYNVKAFNIGLEYELTGATYGDWDKDGSILDNDQLHQVVNHRVCALVKYNF